MALDKETMGQLSREELENQLVEQEAELLVSLKEIGTNLEELDVEKFIKKYLKMEEETKKLKEENKELRKQLEMKDGEKDGKDGEGEDGEGEDGEGKKKEEKKKEKRKGRGMSRCLWMFSLRNFFGWQILNY